MTAVRTLLFIMLVWLTSMMGARAHTLIVISENGGAYAQTRNTLQAELEKSGKSKSEIRTVLANELGWQTSPESPRLVVTLGAEAFRAVLARGPNAAVVASLIPRNVQERLLREIPHRQQLITAVYLDQPLGRQLDLLRLALPDTKRVGVLLGQDLASTLPALQSAASNRRLQVVSAQVEDTTNLYPALRTVLESSDVLLALPDPRVYNSASISNVLLSSYRSRIPVQAFSPAYVKAGALLGLYSSPEQIGVQTAEVVRQFLSSGQLSAPNYPVDYQVDVNEHVARSLGLQISTDNLLDRLRRLERQDRLERRP